MSDIPDDVKTEHERVMGELLACYGEGASTDWEYLHDLAHFIIQMIDDRKPAIERATIQRCIEVAESWNQVTHIRAALRSLLPDEAS